MFLVHFIMCRTLTSKDMNHCIYMIFFLCIPISLDQTPVEPVSKRKNCTFGKVKTNSDFEKTKKRKIHNGRSCSCIDKTMYDLSMKLVCFCSDCSFVTKTINAENAGAVAVLITDNDAQNDEAQIQMVQDGTEREVQIPSLFLLGKDG